MELEHSVAVPRKHFEPALMWGFFLEEGQSNLILLTNKMWLKAIKIYCFGGNSLSTSTPTSETVSQTMTPMTSITPEPAVTASTMTPTIPATAIMTTEAPVTVTQIPMMTRPTQLPTTILPPIVVTPSGDCTSYIAVPSQQIVTGMTEWCNTNCRLGYCPSSHCICIR